MKRIDVSSQTQNYSDQRIDIYMYSNLLTGHSAPLGQTFNIVVLQNTQN